MAESGRGGIPILDYNGTWELFGKPNGADIIGSKWIFKTKRDENEEVTRHKARFVAQGFSQEPGKDYGDTFAPVAKLTSIRTVLALAAREDWELENMDVDTAFLKSDIQEEIYIRQPRGFELSGPNGEELVCKLKKSIYGLKHLAIGTILLIDGCKDTDLTRQERTHAYTRMRIHDEIWM